MLIQLNNVMFNAYFQRYHSGNHLPRLCPCEIQPLIKPCFDFLDSLHPPFCWFLILDHISFSFQLIFLAPLCYRWVPYKCPYSPFVQLFNGHFWRLSTIHRTGETSFTVEGTKVRLTGQLFNFPPFSNLAIIAISSQCWGGGPHRPLRCLSGVHGHRGKLESNFSFFKILNSFPSPFLLSGVSWDHGRHRRLWNIH